MRKRSTCTNLLQYLQLSMTGQLIFSYENVPMLYISIFEKAFVPVSHSKLLIKLKDYGLTGKLASITDVLFNRFQRAKLGNKSSQPIFLSGVPLRSTIFTRATLCIVRSLLSCLSVCPSVCLSVRPSVRLSVCLSHRHTPILCLNG